MSTWVPVISEGGQNILQMETGTMPFNHTVRDWRMQAESWCVCQRGLMGDS